MKSKKAKKIFTILLAGVMSISGVITAMAARNGSYYIYRDGQRKADCYNEVTSVRAIAVTDMYYFNSYEDANYQKTVKAVVTVYDSRIRQNRTVTPSATVKKGNTGTAKATFTYSAFESFVSGYSTHEINDGQRTYTALPYYDANGKGISMRK